MKNGVESECNECHEIVTFLFVWPHICGILHVMVDPAYLTLKIWSLFSPSDGFPQDFLILPQSTVLSLHTDSHQLSGCEHWWVALIPETYKEKLQNITICQRIIHTKLFTGNQANNYETFYFKTYFTFFSSQFTNFEWTKTNTAFIYLRETSMFCQMWHITYTSKETICGYV